MAVAAAQLGALADLASECFPVACHMTKDSCTLLLALLLQRAGWQTCPWVVSLMIVLDAGDSGVER